MQAVISQLLLNVATCLPDCSVRVRWKFVFLCGAEFSVPDTLVFRNGKPYVWWDPALIIHSNQSCFPYRVFWSPFEQLLAVFWRYRLLLGFVRLADEADCADCDCRYYTTKERTVGRM
jgi:hypothetical protein